MASLKDLRRRISSVKNTQQITKAMKMVAASKLNRAQQRITSLRPYTEKLQGLCDQVVENIAASEPNEKTLVNKLQSYHPLLQANKSNKIALIVVSADRGLCGSYNTNVCKFSYNYYKELVENSEVEVELFFYGKKAYNFFKKEEVDGTLITDFWTGELTTDKSQSEAQKFITDYIAGKYKEIKFVYTQFKSALTQNVVAEKLLPLSLDVGSEEKEIKPLPTKIIFEPNKIDILKDLIEQRIRLQFYKVFADSFASEMGSKMTSMDNATRNAGEMISKLTLVMNRTRQAAITKELMEIVGGAEAIKG